MHQIDSDELLEMYLNAFTMSFDPHTDYMSPDTQKNFDIAMSLELEGIGASLRARTATRWSRRSSPAAPPPRTAGIKVDDKIVGVGQGDEGEIVDVIDMKLSDVVKLIRGKRGTMVRLEVMPADGTRAKDLQDHPREDRAEGQRGEGRGVRRRPEARRHALPHRRDRLAQLLPRHGRATAAACPTSRAPPATCATSSTTSTARTSTPWFSTCAATAAAR